MKYSAPIPPTLSAHTHSQSKAQLFGNIMRRDALIVCYVSVFVSA